MRGRAQSAEGKGQAWNLGLLRLEMHVASSKARGSKILENRRVQILLYRLFGPFLLPFRPKSKTDPPRPVLTLGAT